MSLSSLVNENSGRGRRRAIVVVMYFSLAASAVSGFSGPVLESAIGEWIWWLLGPAIALGFPLTVVTFSALRSSVQNLASDKPNKLDERQRTVNYKAHYHSYHIVAWMICIAILYSVLAVQIYPEELWLPGSNELVYVCIAVPWLFITLPTAVAAWTEPASEPEGDI